MATGAYQAVIAKLQEVFSGELPVLLLAGIGAYGGYDPFSSFSHAD